MRTIGKVCTVSALIALVIGSTQYIVAANQSNANGSRGQENRGHDNGKENEITVLDNCLPGDPGWDATGGCTLRKGQGDVPEAEFGALLVSPLTIPPFEHLIGHPSWRNEPSHSRVREGKKIRVVNKGGRGHTFTEVADFGGGFIAGLNIGLTPAPECQPGLIVRLNPGDKINITPTGAGPLHKFQCCIHPWMRATIRVE